MRWLARVVLAVLVATGCGGDREARAQLSDKLIIDCVASWSAADDTRLHFWGDHPDYAPDYAIAYRGRDDHDGVEFRYFVDGDRLRLWIDRGRSVPAVRFKLEVTEDSTHVLQYRLTFDEAVFGERVFEGAMAKSYRCEERGSSARVRRP